MARKGSSKKFWDKVNARRSERWGKIGREFEQTVLQILSEVEEDGILLFDEVIYHEPCSTEDYSGKDFTVVYNVDGQHQSRSFGVTISHRSVQESCMLHPNIPQFHFPIGTKPKTIIKRVKALFNNS